MPFLCRHPVQVVVVAVDADAIIRVEITRAARAKEAGVRVEVAKAAITGGAINPVAIRRITVAGETVVALIAAAGRLNLVRR
jgi:hypothetical protein